MSVYKSEHRLRSEDVNMHLQLRSSALLRMMQESAIRHTEQLGAGREKTLDRGLLWVVTLQYVEIERLPVYDEQISFLSWPGKTMHVLFPRYYQMLDATGETILRASSLWTLIDKDTRKLVFPEKYGVFIDGDATGNEIALPSPFSVPELNKNRRVTVPFSYIDMNGHMSNFRYIDLAEDCIDAPAAGRRLRQLKCEYSCEAKLGETLDISWGEENSEYYISGENGKRVFRICLKYDE